MKVRTLFACALVLLAGARTFSRAPAAATLPANAPRPPQGIQIIRCPEKILASVMEVPAGWKQVPLTDRVALPFSEVDAGRANGKTVISCIYGSGAANQSTIIFQELPPNYICTKTGAREMQCKPGIKIPGK